jgi:hypothetical protein
MRFNLPAAILTFAGIASAFTIPADLPHGSYVVTIDGAGNDNFTLISEVPATTNTHATRLSKRDVSFPSNSEAVCQNSIWFSSDAFYGSNWNGFYETCSHRGSDNVVGKGGSLVNYAGNSVAFMCSYAKSGAPCVPAEWSAAVGKIANKCGQSSGNMQPGFYNIPDWYKVCLSPANCSISLVMS